MKFLLYVCVFQSKMKKQKIEKLDKEQNKKMNEASGIL